MTPDPETVLLNYIHWCNRRGQNVIYGIHVDTTECAPLLERHLIEKRGANGGWSNETIVDTTARGAHLVTTGRAVGTTSAWTQGGAW